MSDQSACPGFALPGRNDDGKYECSCCGRWISKKGYGHSLAPHKAPSHVVQAHAQRVEQEATKYYEARLEQDRRVDAVMRELNKLGMDVSRSEISLPIDTVEKLVAIAQNNSPGAS